MSFDVIAHQRNHIELYGNKGSIVVPDPNMFGGSAFVSVTAGGNWGEHKTDNMPLGKINIIESNKNFSNVLNDIRYGKSIWRLLLIIALTCLILESIIGIPNKDRLKSYLE